MRYTFVIISKSTCSRKIMNHNFLLLSHCQGFGNTTDIYTFVMIATGINTRMWEIWFVTQPQDAVDAEARLGLMQTGGCRLDTWTQLRMGARQIFKKWNSSGDKFIHPSPHISPRYYVHLSEIAFFSISSS